MATCSSPLSSLSPSPSDEIIPDSDSAAPLPSLAPPSPSPATRATKRPRLTRSPSPSPPLQPQAQAQAVPHQSASQDLAFLHQLDPHTLDDWHWHWHPSSDPLPPSTLSQQHQHPRPRPPLHLPTHPSPTTTRSTHDAPRPRPPKSHHHYHQEADDSGVFLNAEELHLSQDMDLAGGDEILLALDAEEHEGEGFDRDGGEEDEMWAGFDEPEVEVEVEVEMDEAEEAGLDPPPPPPPKDPENEDPYADDGFDFALGAAGTQGAEGWDPNMLGGFQLASRKPVKMSEESLRRAKRLLEAEAEEGEGEATAPVPGPAPPPNPIPIASTSNSTFASAFSTASGRPVLAPSSASLAQAAELLGHSTTSTNIPTTTSNTTLTTAPLPLAPIRAPPPPPSTSASTSFAPPALAFGGFTTASGAPVALPSEAALAKARGQVFSSPPPSAPFSGGGGGGGGSQIQSFGGFMTAAGGAVEMPSEEAMERARRSAAGGDVFLDGGGGSSPRRGGGGFRLPGPGGAQRFGLGLEGIVVGAGGKTLESPTTRRSGSSEGRRTPLLPVNDLNVNLATAGGGGGGGPSSPQVQQQHPSSPAPVGGSRPPSRTRHPAPPPTSTTAEPLASTSTSAAAPPPPPQAPTTTRPPPPPRSNPLGTPLPNRLKPTPNPSSAFRSPLLASTSTSRTPGPSSFRPPLLHNNPTHSTPQKPPTATPAPRRLNLGMTPRPRPAPGTPGSRQKKFETPFKGGKRPVGLTPVGVLKSGAAGGGLGGCERGMEREKTMEKGKGRERERKMEQEEEELVRLFDLSPPPNRLSLSEFGMRPQTHYYESLEQLGIPSEILSMILPLSFTYTFPSPSPRSHPEAHSALLSSGANPAFATPNWVKNHYGLIVWKLACYVRSRPDLIGWWTWERVVEGLKYRYEREINRAQRSPIKRIQEQDSPSSLPMVLCVSQLRWDDPPESDPLNPGAEDQPLVIVGLELTDGWYRVRTNVDGTLRRAVERGKIVVGSKVVVVGAKIDSSREGTDVLEALGKSSLLISGNSTTLAPWSTRLGFLPPSSGPFVASLSSLTSDGGVAALLDIVVEKVFPCGFVDLGKGGGHGTWNEEEERGRKEEWVKGRAKAQARLADELEKTSNEWEETIELLQDCVHRVGPAPTASPSPSLEEEEPDEILDRLEGTSTIKEKEAILRKLSPRQANGALALAGEMAVQARYAAQEELEKELAVHGLPPRDVRGFRVLRIKDARIGSKPFTSKRTAQLTVWDADSLGADFFQQGARYFVTNVIPKGTWKRQSEEITLATRRDSRWRASVGAGAQD
ncbi:hypothetical protein BCR35DRAFT_332060 [Leucosporidium creatinivorum]|uniref:BRCA2 OB1 domain-containing protein n=1 Tax=Leucosporidium creatinivorum TaxID=106004 RepID=A0A1Y2F5U5_9BASI|nr:hypothetical protein BCR35DRAFT_332060 [Leucosporidium creatinivorum]